jgi:5-methylcytosine-specific restriction enzyme A
MKPPRHLPPNQRNGLCNCGCGRAPVAPRKRFFERACVDRYFVAKYPANARARLLVRDKGICAACGLDCLKAWQELLDVAPMRAHVKTDGGATRRVADRGDPVKFRLLLVRYGLSEKAFHRRRSLFDVHHKLEVVNGGGCCDLTNLQTLCYRCHKEKTADLNRRMKCS